MKKCNKCNQEKDLTCFNKRKDSKDGYRSECKSCLKNIHKEYYLNCSESILLNHKKYHSANRDKDLSDMKEYNKLHPR